MNVSTPSQLVRKSSHMPLSLSQIDDVVAQVYRGHEALEHLVKCEQSSLYRTCATVSLKVRSYLGIPVKEVSKKMIFEKQQDQVRTLHRMFSSIVFRYEGQLAQMHESVDALIPQTITAIEKKKKTSIELEEQKHTYDSLCSELQGLDRKADPKSYYEVLHKIAHGYQLLASSGFSKELLDQQHQQRDMQLEHLFLQMMVVQLSLGAARSMAQETQMYQQVLDMSIGPWIESEELGSAMHLLKEGVSQLSGCNAMMHKSYITNVRNLLNISLGGPMHNIVLENTDELHTLIAQYMPTIAYTKE